MRDLGLPELGFMVENTVLQRALWDRLQEQDVTLLCPAKLEALEAINGGWRFTLDNGEMHTARLVIGADGANSQVRQRAGIGIHGWNYSQSCMLISIRAEHDAGDCTGSNLRPTARAPICLFSMAGHRWSGMTIPPEFASCRQ